MCVTCSQLAKQVIASLWPYLRKHTQRHTSAYFETQEENAHIYHSVVFPHFQRENTHTYLHTQLLYIRLSHPDDTLHKLSEAVKHTYAQMQSQGKERKCRLYYVIRHTHTHTHTNTKTHTETHRTFQRMGEFYNNKSNQGEDEELGLLSHSHLHVTTRSFNLLFY